jgi:hypothetical protein
MQMCILFLWNGIHEDATPAGDEALRELAKRYKLIIADNRDEFFSRPTLTPRFWEDHPHIFAGERPCLVRCVGSPRQHSTLRSSSPGRDLQAGGTWLGLSVAPAATPAAADLAPVRFGVLTNFRTPKDEIHSLMGSVSTKRGLALAALVAGLSAAAL